MSDTEAQRPQPTQPVGEVELVGARDLPDVLGGAPIDHFHVDEFASSVAGSLSPYGQDVEFPWPVEWLRYTHPGPADRPNLAGGH